MIKGKNDTAKKIMILLSIKNILIINIKTTYCNWDGLNPFASYYSDRYIRNNSVRNSKEV